MWILITLPKLDTDSDSGFREQLKNIEIPDQTINGSRIEKI
jgi:hypothetical protein